MLYQNRQFTRMLNVMQRQDDFRPSYLTVFTCLMEWTNSGTNTTYPSQGVIARECGYCRETVNRAVKWLRDKAFILTDHRRRKVGKAVRWLSNWYRMAEDLEHVDWMRQRRLQQAIKNLFKRAKPVAYPAVPPAGPPPPTQADKDAVYAYWMEQFAQEVSCDTESIAPSSSISNSDMLTGAREKIPPDGGV